MEHRAQGRGLKRAGSMGHGAWSMERRAQRVKREVVKTIKGTESYGKYNTGL